MIFYRIARAKYDHPQIAFSGDGASKYAHRWNHPASDIRAVYCSDSLALACLECLVHVRPSPRHFPPSVYYIVDIPDRQFERPDVASLPADWASEAPSMAARDYGMTFLRGKAAAGMIVPTAIQPLGLNLLLNPLHPAFDFAWVTGPFAYHFDNRSA